MVQKGGIYAYQETLKALEVAGSNLFKHLKHGPTLFQSDTEKFLNQYNDIFPCECRILRTYALKIINNHFFSVDELYLMQYLVKIMVEDFDKTVKRPKIFISHCEKDNAVVESFVDLLSHIGVTSEMLFCSSIPGYNIRQGSGDIYEYLRNEFSNNNLFVIFMLSENYYNSTACLNEMGASWVLQQKYQSILLSGFDFSQIKGAINPRDICFKLDDQKNRGSALGELKDNIIRFLELQDVNTSKWDYQRERFFSKVDAIQI